MSRPAAITYWTRSLLPIDMKSAANSAARKAAAGTSTIMPSGGGGRRHALGAQPDDDLLEQPRGSLELGRRRDHRRHDFQAPAAAARASARS